MVFGLGKLFGGGKAPENSPSQPETPTVEPAAPQPAHTSAFIRRDAVFDRKRQPVGHLYRLQHADAGLGDAPTRRQKPLDDALLGSLCSGSGDEGWGKGLAFIPLCTASLDNRWLDRLPAQNTVLLLVLAPETAEPEPLAARLEILKTRGMKFGVFRQPKHPAFPAVLGLSDFAAIDVAGSQGGNVRDFSVVIRSDDVRNPVELFAANLETLDDYHLAHRCHFNYFHGPFVKANEKPETNKGGDPHKVHLMNLMNLVQGDADNAAIAEAVKQDPLLTFRILRYLNSPAIGLARKITAIDQALVMLGRQKLARWLSVLLFSVKDPDFSDWLMVESSLGRGRVLELLGSHRFPAGESDHLFLTGVFSCLDKLLRMPMAEAVAQLHLPANVKNAILERTGPYAPLLAVAEACEAFDPARIEAAAQAAGFEPDAVNNALIAATAWASEITEHWE